MVEVNARMGILRRCAQCAKYQGPTWRANPGQDAPKIRVTSKTEVMGKCGVTGEATKPDDPACDSFREGA